MDIIGFVYGQYPHLKRDLIAAKMRIAPYDFISKNLRMAFMYAVLSAVLIAMPTFKEGWNPFLPVFGFVFVFLFFFMTQMQTPRARMAKRIKNIDNDVLFTGRFLLIKLSSGRPLLNALDDTARSPGYASLHVKEIVDDINFGTPIEEALRMAAETSPSKYMRKILFQIHSAIRVGIDVTSNLQAVLDEIENEQALEIEKYAKKLNTVALFYMIAAVVVPSLGLTIAMVVLALISFPVNAFIYGVMIFFIVIINLFFIMVFRGIRPAVNI
jgi:pilus assembly protein TadC